MLNKEFLITFIINIFVGMGFNAMNMMAYNINHLYVSVTLFYVGCIMASNMVWSHEIIHYVNHGMFNVNTFLFGIVLTLFFVYLARNQVGVNKDQWFRRMIPHHSTALTTSEKLLENNNNLDKTTKKLASDIIDVQNKEINLMKKLLNKK